MPRELVSLDATEPLRIRSDHASEFNSAQVIQIYLDHAIKRHFSNPGQHFQNGKAENILGMYG
jgi:transposase InsO family protein